jgi:hypothetical protein
VGDPTAADGMIGKCPYLVFALIDSAYVGTQVEP